MTVRLPFRDRSAGITLLQRQEAATTIGAFPSGAPRGGGGVKRAADRMRILGALAALEPHLTGREHDQVDLELSLKRGGQDQICGYR
jgi:hypothetical protein